VREGEKQIEVEIDVNWMGGVNKKHNQGKGRRAI